MEPAPLTRDQLIALMVAEADSERCARGQVRVVEWPDAERRTEEAVEFRGADDRLELVVEHTRIQSYADQAKDHAIADRIFPGKFGPELPERPEAGYMRLSVPTGALAKVPVAQRARVAEVLTTWVRDNIDRVPPPHRPGPDRLVHGRHDDVPFPWAMWQAITFDVGLAGPLACVAQLIFSQPADLESRRVSVIRDALDRKLPKLLAAAGRTRRSILVLEERDSRLSSPVHVSYALAEASSGRVMPDVVYLLHTCHGDPHLLILREGDQWAHDGENRFNRLPFSLVRTSQLNAMEVSWK